MKQNILIIINKIEKGSHNNFSMLVGSTSLISIQLTKN